MIKAFLGLALLIMVVWGMNEDRISSASKIKREHVMKREQQKANLRQRFSPLAELVRKRRSHVQESHWGQPMFLDGMEWKNGEWKHGDEATLPLPTSNALPRSL